MRFVLLTGLLAAAVAAGCGSSSSDTADTGTGGAGGAAGAGGDDSGAAGGGGADGATDAGGEAAACPSGLVAAGDQTIQLDFGGTTRNYILHVPPSYDGSAPVPLVVNFHGYTSNAAQQELFSAMNPKADSAGFLVAYPNGTGSGTDTGWNAGACCASAAANGVDDVGFTRALVADVEARACVDPKRVYATGMSNGGFMSHRLGCEAADLFAAVAPVAGVLGIPEASCTPSRPMPVIHFHGTADTLVPYDGNASLGFPSVPDTFAGWAKRDGCTDAQPKQTFQNGAATCTTYEQCSGGVKVTLCTLTGEGHCWPGQTLCPFGASTTDLSADDAMWDFFTAYALP